MKGAVERSKSCSSPTGRVAITLIIGYPKAGKDTHAMNVTRDPALGLPFAKRKVLYS